MRGRAVKATWRAWRSISNPSPHPVPVKHFSTNRPFFPLGAASPTSTTTKDSTLESVDAFESRIFQGGASGNETYNSREDAFFENLDRQKNARLQWDVLDKDDDDSADVPDGIPEGIYAKFKQSAVDYDFYDEKGEGWLLMDKLTPYRPDAELYDGSHVDEEFYDLKKPPSYTNAERREFTVTTAEVLAKADFRNVRFLANFITDAGIIIKRSQTGISAKAQRKVAREIKTARAFGLMPFTTMGTKSFVFGRTMEGLDEDFEYESYDGPMGAGAVNDERLGA